MFASKDLFLTRPSGYQISRSVRLRSSASAYLSRTFGTPTNNNTWTFSAWMKRGSVSSTGTPIFVVYVDANNYTNFTIDANQQMNFAIVTSGVARANSITSQVFRDPAAWYHVVLVANRAETTESNRIKMYINGVQVTAWATAPTWNNSYDSAINGNGQVHRIGNRSTAYFDGYLTEINFIDGQALTPSSFGETNSVTGVWQPIKYTGTYGTNGFYLNFSDNSGVTATTIGKDYSGNGNNWTPSAGISITAGATYDSMLDVPTPYADGGNGRGNYAVLNPLLSAGGTTANGNLQVTTATGVGHSRATIAMPASGKWYCEFTAVSAATATDYIFGIVGIDTAEASYGYNQTPSYSYSAFGEKIVNGSYTASFYSSYTTGDVIGCAVNLDANEITWYKNGVAQTAISITNGSYFWIVSDASGTRQITAAFNAGQRPFTYTPPTGFIALNTQNLPTPTISNGAQYMAATTYTGNGTSQTITNAGGFAPDLVWIKGRSYVDSHTLFDTVRGATQSLSSNTTTAEVTRTTALTAFTSTGFTVSSDTLVNYNANTLVGWQWNAGGSTVTNTSGTISSQVRANATAGFSVVTYTGNGTGGATVGHGLGVAPRMVIVKPRIIVDNWNVYHASNGASPATQVLYLNLTNATSTNSTIWNNTAPTSSVFSIGTNSGINTNGSTYVAYCFAEVAGYSAFGKYTGNGSADGPFVYCGFRPRFVLVKRTDVAATWYIWNTSSNTFNVIDTALFPNLTNAESSNVAYYCDILSNGFKPRATNTDVNANGGTYIYMAFSEVGFKYALGR